MPLAQLDWGPVNEDPLIWPQSIEHGEEHGYYVDDVTGALLDPRQVEKARAEEIAAVGAAEASAIQAKGQAEALVLKEKNQTYQYMGEAGITDIVMNKMPEIAGAIAAPLSKTEKMVFISQDDATGSKVTKDIIKTIATLPDAVEGLTGLDLKNAIAKATRL